MTRAAWMAAERAFNRRENLPKEFEMGQGNRNGDLANAVNRGRDADAEPWPGSVDLGHEAAVGLIA